MADIFNFTDTWNNGGTTFNAIKVDVTDTASASGSMLMDLQVGSVSKFSVSKTGAVTSAVGTLISDMAETWNSGGTTFTAIKFNVTDTASAAASLLMDLQVGGVSQVTVTKTGSIVATGGIRIDGGSPVAGAVDAHYLRSDGFVQTGLYYINGTNATITSPAAAVIKLAEVNQNDFDRLQFGGSTTSYPALKRSSAELHVKLADDSAPAPLRFGFVTKAGAFTNSDITTGQCAVGYDSSGGTWKLLVNQGGTLRSVALS